MEKRKKWYEFRGDKPLWVIIGALCFVSIFVVASSTVSMAYKNMGGDTSVYVLRQFTFLLFGIIVAFFVALIQPRFYLKRSKLWLILSVILAILAYTPPFGATINGASRWFSLGGISFLPSDPLKISLVMYLAVRLGNRQAYISNMKLLPALTSKGWRRSPRRNSDILHGATIPLVLPIAISALVVLFANLSTAVIIVFVSLMMLLVARVRFREVLKLGAVAMGAVVILITVMSVMGIGRAETWVNRIKSYVSPIVSSAETDSTKVQQRDMEDQFQKTQAKIAVAMGGAIGRGPGNSTQRSQLPHPYSDFAYAFIIEEYGLLGGLVILFLYLLVLFRAGVVVRMSQNPTYSLLVVGLALVIVTPAFINMGVSVGLIPVTGQPMPMVSMGGTSVLFTSLAFGVILGVSRYVAIDYKRRKELERAALSDDGFVVRVTDEHEEAQYEENYDETYDEEYNPKYNQDYDSESPVEEEPTPQPEPKFSPKPTPFAAPRRAPKPVVEEPEEEFVVRDASEDEPVQKSDKREVYTLED